MNGFVPRNIPPTDYEAPFYPPYLYQPIMVSQPQMYLRQKLSGPNLAHTLRTAQKTLNTAARIIPLVYQIQPVLHNAKTALRVAKAMQGLDLEEENEPIDIQPITKAEEITNFQNPYTAK